VYLGDRLLPGARETVLGLRDAGIPVRFLSNNPTKNPAEYAQKLGQMGLPTPVEEITNTVVSTTRWLRANAPGAVVYPIAEMPVIDALRAAGIAISDDPRRIDIVLASYDRTFTYAKLQIAFDALWRADRGARLMSTNPDRYCPFTAGRGEPDTAGIVAAIEATTGVRCERTFGKPEAPIAQMAWKASAWNLPSAPWSGTGSAPTSPWPARRVWLRCSCSPVIRDRRRSSAC